MHLGSSLNKIVLVLFLTHYVTKGVVHKFRFDPTIMAIVLMGVIGIVSRLSGAQKNQKIAEYVTRV